jgi:hypothetical protein
MVECCAERRKLCVECHNAEYRGNLTRDGVTLPRVVLPSVVAPRRQRFKLKRCTFSFHFFLL